MADSSNLSRFAKRILNGKEVLERPYVISKITAYNLFKMKKFLSKQTRLNILRRSRKEISHLYWNRSQFAECFGITMIRGKLINSDDLSLVDWISLSGQSIKNTWFKFKRLREAWELGYSPSLFMSFDKGSIANDTVLNVCGVSWRDWLAIAAHVDAKGNYYFDDKLLYRRLYSAWKLGYKPELFILQSE